MIGQLILGIFLFFVTVAILLSIVIRRAVRKIQYALNHATYFHSDCENCKIDLAIRQPPPSTVIEQYTPEMSSFLIQEIYALEQSYHNKTSYAPPPGVTTFTLLTTTDGPYGVTLVDGQGRTYILFRGSISEYEKQIDVKYTQQSAIQGVLCHDGFLELYTYIKPQLPTVNGFLVIAGHSLGGAIASLSAVDMYRTQSKVLYTYGCPRVFGIGATTAFKDIPYYRVINTEDLIPTLPPAVIPNFTTPEEPYYYEHFGKPLSFTANWKCGLCNHLLPVYSQFIQLL